MQRVAYQTPIMVRRSGGNVHRGTAENISEDGMMLHISHDEVVAGDMLLWITFALPDIPNLVQVQAQVVHQCRDGQLVSLGVKFMPMPANLRNLLRATASSNN